jgi:hypothetical protein
MNRIKSRFVKFSSTALALLITLLTTLLLVPGGASAKGHNESSRSSGSAKVLGSGQVASGRAEFYLCLEWRRIMGGLKASGSAAGPD